jgi:hypothetical protein
MFASSEYWPKLWDVSLEFTFAKPYGGNIVIWEHLPNRSSSRFVIYLFSQISILLICVCFSVLCLILICICKIFSRFSLWLIGICAYYLNSRCKWHLNTYFLSCHLGCYVRTFLVFYLTDIFIFPQFCVPQWNFYVVDCGHFLGFVWALYLCWSILKYLVYILYFGQNFQAFINLSKNMRVESYVTTDGQSASLSWNKAPIWGLRPDFICSTVAGLLMWGALSDERTGLSFTIAAGPRQRSHSRVRVPWDSRPYFTVSDTRLPFSSPPTTRRATVEVFDPASTRDSKE